MKRKPAKAPKLDRRIQRTRALLREALMDLVIEKGYDATSVQDILDRSNLGRSTFYAHFHDKDELLVSGLDHLKQRFDEQDAHVGHGTPGGRAQRYSPALLFFKHVEEHHRLFKALMGQKGGELIQRYLYKYLGQMFGRHLAHLAPDDKYLSVPRDLLTHHVITSFLALVGWWVERNMPYPAERMADIYHDLIIPSLNSVLVRK